MALSKPHPVLRKLASGGQEGGKPLCLPGSAGAGTACVRGTDVARAEDKHLTQPGWGFQVSFSEEMAES